MLTNTPQQRSPDASGKGCRLVAGMNRLDLHGHFLPKRKATVRRAVAAVEAAVSLPLLVLLVFGSMEVANTIFLTQALSFASYEGAREGARPGATTVHVRNRVAEVMNARGITNFNVTVTPALAASTARGTMVTVTVESPANSLSIHSIGLFGGSMKSKQVSMVRH
jgi:Flp pilus assembly protein TadG